VRPGGPRPRRHGPARAVRHPLGLEARPDGLRSSRRA
jgi:hypothetical protein